MNTQPLPPPAQFQKIAQPLEVSAPKSVSGNFIRIKYDMAKAVQGLPEMTHDELLKANDLAGGYQWLEHPSEDIYT
jgi:hypothetical protein